MSSFDKSQHKLLRELWCINMVEAKPTLCSGYVSVGWSQAPFGKPDRSLYPQTTKLGGGEGCFFGI